MSELWEREEGWKEREGERERKRERERVNRDIPKQSPPVSFLGQVSVRASHAQAAPIFNSHALPHLHVQHNRIQ